MATVKVIEIAGRLSGDFSGRWATPVSCGVDLVKASILLCLGREVAPESLTHRFERAAAIRFAFPQPGKVISVSGMDRVLKDPACSYAYLFVSAGDSVQPISNHPGRPAVVVASGGVLQEAIAKRHATDRNAALGDRGCTSSR